MARRKVTLEGPISLPNEADSITLPQRVVISNTTPMINFAEIGRMELLQQLFGEIVIPTAVAEELRIKSDRFAGAAVVCELPFVRVQSVRNRRLVTALQHEIHAGEAECIALALEQPSAIVILDDLAARFVAQQHGLPIIGTVGCLQFAKQKRLIARIAPLLGELRDNARFWLSPRLIERVLEDAQEGPIE